MTETETETTRIENLRRAEAGLTWALEQLTTARRAGDHEEIEFWGMLAEKAADQKAKFLWA